MKGLEPTTFCMASARDRSRPFAQSPCLRGFPYKQANATEPERTPEPYHPCHGVGRPRRLA